MGGKSRPDGLVLSEARSRVAQMAHRQMGDKNRIGDGDEAC